MAFASFLEEICPTTGEAVNPMTKIIRCYRAQQLFQSKLPNTISDMLTVLHVKKNCLMLIDSHNIKVEKHIKWKGKGNESRPVLLLVKTNIQITSPTNIAMENVIKCTHALEILRRRYDWIKSLHDVTPEMLQTARVELSESLYKVVNKVVSDNKQVIRAVEAIQECDFHALGE